MSRIRGLAARIAGTFRRSESIGADVRSAVRQFRRTPLSTFTIVAVLSIGLGTTVVVSTLLSSLATMPAPGVSRDDSVVRIRGTMALARLPGVHARPLSWPEVQDYASRTDVFSSVAAYVRETVLAEVGDGSATALPVTLIYATPEYFSSLGVRPVLGTEPFSAGEVMELAGVARALISHAFWRQQFGGAADVIGRTVRINGIPVEIAGVAPRRFVGTDGGGGMTLWTSLAAYPLIQKRMAAAFHSYDSTFLSAIARMRPGVSRASASVVVAGIAERADVGRRSGAARFEPGVGASDGSDRASADVAPLLAGNARVSTRADLMVSGAAAGTLALLVLLVACLNVSALLAGVAAARRREVGVRLALGAPRRRIIRQLLTESILLALIAVTVGLGATAVAIELIGDRLEAAQLIVSWRVVLASCACAIVTGVLFGVSPALLATRVSISDVLRSSSASILPSRARLQRALVVMQVAMTQPLLVGLGVIVATVMTDVGSLRSADLAARVMELELDAWTGGVTVEERESGIAALVERVRAIPGVVVSVPMQMGTITVPVAVHPDDRIGVDGQAAMTAHFVAAPEGYFEAYGIPIVRGRDFEEGEYALATRDITPPLRVNAAIVGSDLAGRLWRGADPIGRRLVMALGEASPAVPMTVIGVIDEAAAGPGTSRDVIRVYIPYSPMNTGVVARTALPAAPLLNELRRAAVEEVPQMPVVRAQTLEQREAEARRHLVRTSAAVAAGGALALLLSAVSLYATGTFAVRQRWREIGVRTALGARPGQIVWLFFRSGTLLGASGLVVGLPLSVLAVRGVAAYLRLPVTTSPVIGAVIGIVVLGVTAAAAWIPARRAGCGDPNLALRPE